MHIAQALGVSEGTIRYLLRRDRQPDHRQGNRRQAEALAEGIDGSLADNQPLPGSKEAKRWHSGRKSAPGNTERWPSQGRAGRLSGSSWMLQDCLFSL
jgi:hypothetical protein